MEENKLNSLDIYNNDQYNLPDANNVIVDVKAKEIVKKEDLTPFQILKALALQMGVKVQDPKPGCKKCYGRGYTALDFETKSPLPCNCIYPPKTENDKSNESVIENMATQGMKLNRLQRRNLQKSARKRSK